MPEQQASTAEIVFPEHYGFCEGVVAADNLLRMVAHEAHEHGIANIYGYHEVVHNDDVVAQHEARGVIFVDNADQIPPESIVVASAHGVSPEIKYALEASGSLVFDAACPLVLHTHRGVERARQNNEKVIYICQGKPGSVPKLHDEVAGMVGHLDYLIRDGQLVHEPLDRSYIEIDEHPSKVPDLISESGHYRIISQTTLHAQEALLHRQTIRAYIQGFQPEASFSWSPVGEVCKAVRDRQTGVQDLIQLNPGRLVVVTDPKSKNGSSYVKLASELVRDGGLETEVVALANADQARELEPIEGLTAITASASTPDETLFAVAIELGLQDTPQIERKTFQLKDAQEGYIANQINSFVGRIGLSTSLIST